MRAARMEGTTRTGRSDPPNEQLIGKAARRVGTSGAAPVVRVPLEASLDPLDALDVLACDAHPFALVGDWAGGGALLGSEPDWVLDDGSGADPFAALARPGALPTPSRTPLDAPLGEVLVGFLSYRLGEELLGVTRAGGRLPRFALAHYDHLLRYVAAERRWYFESACEPSRREAVAARAEQLGARLVAREARRDLPGERARRPGGSIPVLACEAGETAHAVAVERCVQAIHAGELFEANICTAFSGTAEGGLLERFVPAADSLRPAYGAYLAGPGFEVASLSPELFLACDGERVVSEPIKGTRPRTGAPGEREAARVALTGSAKDLAENVTIVDLVRNDLARSSASGSVEVVSLAALRPGPGVWHLVSTVAGRLAPGRDVSDALRLAFPPGSVSGAPKMRAVELAAALEASPRDLYTGAIGYVCPRDGRGEWNVAIRSFTRVGDRVTLGVGGGITAESLPGQEWAECLAKAEPLAAAMGFSLRGPRRSCRGSEGWPGDPGEGVFTTLLVLDGVAIDAWRHLRRLAWSCEALYGETLPAGIEEAIADAAGTSSAARLRVDVAPGGRFRCTVAAWPITDATGGPGVVAATVRVPGPLGAHKLADRRRLERLVGPCRARGRWPLLVAPEGEVTEADVANVALLSGGTLVVAPDDGRALPGVGREVLLEVAGDLGVPVDFARIGEGRLARADAILLTNALRGLVPVARLEGSAYRLRNEALVRALSEAIWGRWRAQGALGAATPGPGGSPHPGRLAHASRTAARPAGPPRRGTRVRLALLDNRDSFVYNLAHYLSAAGAAVEVVPSDAVTVVDLVAMDLDGLVLSPGPGGPAGAGVCVEAVARLSGSLPILGVCLGHQAIAAAFSGRVTRARRPVHGRVSLVESDRLGLLAALPARFLAARYHALAVDPTAPGEGLRVVARAEDGTVMALAHEEHPTFGVQFHPEAAQSEWGNELIGAFVECCSSRPDASVPRSGRRARSLAGAGATPAPSARACP